MLLHGWIDDNPTEFTLVSELNRGGGEEEDDSPPDDHLPRRIIVHPNYDKSLFATLFRSGTSATYWQRVKYCNKNFAESREETWGIYFHDGGSRHLDPCHQSIENEEKYRVNTRHAANVMQRLADELLLLL
jgi:hypothetical protein